MEIVTDQARRCKPENTQSELLAQYSPPAVLCVYEYREMSRYFCYCSRAQV